jgi:hypothetical protein
VPVIRGNSVYLVYSFFVIQPAQSLQNGIQIFLIAKPEDEQVCGILPYDWQYLCAGL